MADEKDNSIDLLGIKPISKSIEKVTDGIIDGARAFLSRVCLPAAEEYGLLLRDNVASWRLQRAALLAKKAEEKVRLHHGDENVVVHPRIAHSVLDEGSWVEDDVVHDMWAGLLASGCDMDGSDDSNIVFIGLLKQLTSIQVRILRFAVESADKYVTSVGWPVGESVRVDINRLQEIAGTRDLLRLDRELDHLRSLELIGAGLFSGGGFSPDSDEADISPSPLALHLYVRAEGFPGTPVEYWALQQKPKPEPKPKPNPKIANPKSVRESP